MGMTAGAGGRRLQSEINVTPMVDIMLVLLIIFMVVTPFLQPGITVPVPRDMNNPDVDSNIIKQSSVVISIPKDVEYYLGKKRLQKEQLAEEVNLMIQKLPHEQDRIVYIKSGVGVSYGEVVNVINEVRKLGVDKIGFVADKKRKDSAVSQFEITPKAFANFSPAVGAQRQPWVGDRKTTGTLKAFANCLPFQG